LSDDKRLTPVDVVELTGIPRNVWSAAVTRGYAPPPDGRTEKGNHPWWLESTIRDFMRWKADPDLSRTPTPPLPAVRFAEWRKRQAAGSVIGGDPLPVDVSGVDRERLDFTDRHIRRHRRFDPEELAALVDELRGAPVAGRPNPFTEEK